MPNRSSTRMQFCISARCESPLPATKTSATTCFFSMSSRSAAVPRMLGEQAIVDGLVIEPKMTEHAPVVGSIADLEAGVAAERTDADDEHLPDGHLAAVQPARGRAQPEDARQGNEHEAIELAASRVRRDEEPQGAHHDQHRREQNPGQHDVAGERPPVPAVVVPQDPPSEHPHEDAARPHAQKHEPVPGLSGGLGGGRAGCQQDDAVTDEVQVLRSLLGHLTDAKVVAQANAQRRRSPLRGRSLLVPRSAAESRSGNAARGFIWRARRAPARRDLTLPATPPHAHVMPTSRATRLVARRPEELAEQQQSVGLELDELQTDVELRPGHRPVGVRSRPLRPCT